VQPGAEAYLALGVEMERVVFDVYHQNTDLRGSTFFQFLGGPAWGSVALTTVIKYFGWSSVIVYYQNDPYDIRTADAFMQQADSQGIKFALAMRETVRSTADERLLLAAASNVFIFFGGVDSTP
jgi:hypothetical protein